MPLDQGLERPIGGHAVAFEESVQQRAVGQLADRSQVAKCLDVSGQILESLGPHRPRSSTATGIYPVV